MANPLKTIKSLLPSGPTRYLRIALPFIHSAGQVLEAEAGDNTDSAAYKAGLAVDYVGDVIDSITTGQPIPFPPDGLFTAEQLTEAAEKAKAAA